MSDKKKLTPEEQAARDFALEMMDKHFPEIDGVDPMWLRISDIYFMSYKAHVSTAKKAIADKTASRDEEIQSLKEKISGLLNADLVPVVKEAEEFTALIEKIASQDERIKELEAKVQMLNEQGEEGEREYNAMSWNKDARIAELENKYNKSCEDRDNSDGWATEMKRQRDQAFDLLERHTYTANTDERMGWLSEKNTLLSSRENKKPEQVDIVCPLCNGKGFTWALNRLGDDDAKECPRCQGIGKTTENKTPNE